MNNQKKLEVKVRLLDDQNRRLKEEVSEYEDKIAELEEQVDSLKNALQDQDFFSSTYPSDIFEDR